MLVRDSPTLPQPPAATNLCVIPLEGRVRQASPRAEPRMRWAGGSPHRNTEQVLEIYGATAVAAFGWGARSIHANRAIDSRLPCGTLILAFDRLVVTIP